MSTRIELDKGVARQNGISLRSIVNKIIGSDSQAALAHRPESQVQLAVCTSLLAIAANAATLVFGYELFPAHVYWMTFATLLLFISVLIIYRWLVPRFPWTVELANNLVPATLCLACGYTAITLGGNLSMSATYASAIPLLSVMICRLPLALLWSSLMIGLLSVGIVVEPIQPFTTPRWLTLAGGITVVVPTLLSMLLHRKIWEAALSDSAFARQQLLEQHEQQRALDKRIATYERQESLGLMAGRVAHDLNNLLTAVVTSVELCKYAIQTDQRGDFLDSLETIECAAQNAGKLSAQLLDYTGKKRHTMVAVNLSERLPTAATLGQAASPRGTQVRVDAEADVWVQGDPVYLDQVIVNLIRNAAQAYEPSSGVVDIHLERVTTAEHIHCVGRCVLETGDYVRLRVRDQGRGISPEHLDRIFDPFFTDRANGHGLGLAAVTGIVGALGGGVRVSSQPQHGTEFQVILPTGQAPLAGSFERTKPANKIAGTVSGQEPILLVDDERAVRDAIEKLLTRCGYPVICAADGHQALDILASGEEIRAILLDVSMPVMDGYETLERLRKQHETLPVLLVSGYARASKDQAASDPHTEWLSKPFSASDLQAWMKRVGLANKMDKSPT